MAITSLHPRGDVLAHLNFYSPPADGSKPYNNADLPPHLPPRNYSSFSQPVLIHDARPNAQQFTLDNDAFRILLSQSPSSEVSFTDDASIQKNYYPEVESLLLSAVPGANKVIIFDHTIRRTDPSAPRAPVQSVHIDQTLASTIQRVKRHAGSPGKAESLLKGRYRIINVWRPLNKNPVETYPLAFASSSTLGGEEIIPVEHRYTATGYIGQIAAIAYHPDQKWYYLSGMTGDERILLECFDSEALKESIEVRALVFGP